MARILLKNLVLSVSLCILFSHNIYTEDNVCTEQTSCLCKLSNGSYIDISHVAPKDQPYLNVTTRDQFTYYFYPCKDVMFDVKAMKLDVNRSLNECESGTSLCLYNTTGKSLINLGTTHDSTFSFNTKSLVFTKPKSNITSIISLICTPDSFKPYFETSSRQTELHQLLLFSSNACMRNEHRGLSTGSALLILLSVVFGVYLLGGAVVLHFLRGARGKEMIPNLDFWTNLPYLVRDGVIFLLNGCNPMSVSNAETYDRI